MTEVQIQVKGLDHLMKMTVPDNLLGPAVRGALTRSVIDIEGGQKRLAPVDRGRLRAAITHQVGPGELPTWAKAGVIGGGGTLGTYAEVMDQGRRPDAAMPPVAPIRDWLRRHGSSAPPFVVARAIGRRGIKGKKFIVGGYEQVRGKVDDHFARAARDVETRWRNNV